MSDDELSKLERAWKSGGDQEDRLRWLQAKARTTGLLYDLQREALARFDLDRVRSDLEAVLRDCVRELDPQEKGSTFDAWKADTATRIEAAANAHRLDGYQGGWIYSQFIRNTVLPKTPPTPAHIPALLATLVDAIDRVHRDIAARYAFMESLSFPLADDDFEAAFRSVVARTIDWVIETTNCDDAWYSDASYMLVLVCQAAGVPMDDQTEAEFENLVEAHFHSWTTPNGDGVQAVISGLTLTTLRRKFEDRYGALD